MKLIIWGIGRYWEYIRRYINWNMVEVNAFIDSNPRQNYIEFNNKKVLLEKPDAIAKYNYDYLLIASNLYNDEIKKELINMGISEDKIIEALFDEKFKLILDEKELILDLNSDISSIKRILDSDRRSMKRIQNKLQQRMNDLLIQNGRIWAHSIKDIDKVSRLSEVGFKVFSQWDEDGIIQWLITKIPIKNKTFIEFGVENYKEANTRFLLINNNWSGMVIDGSQKYINQVYADSIMWMHDLKAIAEFITKDNINDLLLRAGFDKDLGLLSIDIDGNDFWVLQEIEVVQPRILILEYNSIWGGEKKVTIPYKEDFIRENEHYSYLYWGMSFAAAKYMAEKKGYIYVGSNLQNSNAFFVRSDLASYLDISAMDLSWESAKFRESRDEQGRLTYLSLGEGIKLMRDKELFDIEERRVRRISDIYLFD